MLFIMILRPRTSSRRRLEPIGKEPPTALVSVPRWLRKATEDVPSLEDAAIAAGAAIAALDAVVRRQERWAGAWRQRLALAAAAVTTRQTGRVEDEAALRDAVLLTRPGDDVGPAGRMLLAWRRLASRPADDLLTEAGVAGMLTDMGVGHDDEAVSGLVDDLRQLVAGEGMAGMLTGPIVVAERHGFGRDLGSWLADALVAQKLGWPHAVPLLGVQGAPGSGAWSRTGGLRDQNPAADVEVMRCGLAAQARAALSAIDLSAELGRRADRLIAVSPKLRAKGSDLVVEKLLSDDAATASQPFSGMSDRGLRRLFDRLVDLGAVRELSGRATFRIYGL